MSYVAAGGDFHHLEYNSWSERRGNYLAQRADSRYTGLGFISSFSPNT